MASSADGGTRAPLGRRTVVDDHERQELTTGWEAARTAPDAHPGPAGLDGLTWLPARVPGTAAAVLEDAGTWRPGDPGDLDAEDWWFRTRLRAAPAAPGEQVMLRLDGLATTAEVHLGGELILSGDSMFEEHAVDVGDRLTGDDELAIRFRALGPQLQGRRKPRARWRTRLVAQPNLRFVRTALLGRAPGFAPGPAPVGPYRPVVLERRRRLAVDELHLLPRLSGGDGVLAVRAVLRGLEAGRAAGGPATVSVELSGPSGTHRADLTVTPVDGGVAVAAGELRVPAVARWWPHTHGEPVLHAVRLQAGGVGIDAGRVGFRDLAAGAGATHAVEADGLDLHVNGVRVFARGAVWTPADPVGLAPDPAALRGVLETVRDAGLNLLRVPGIGAYETAAFHDLCDELGLLVWQDAMFANLDYPFEDEGFRETVEREAAAQLAALAGRPSLAVVCGNSEVEQQVAMLGLDAELGRGTFFGHTLPALVSASGADAVYVPSAPCGGDLPFRPDRGIANYYGVGAYLRPLEDARRSGVRFAAECLAFANVPDADAIEAVLPGSPADVVVHHPRWKAGVPRDAGAGWDFEDVRDHYLAALFGVDPVALRRTDHERYLELSRAVTGEVMAEVFGEWRRAASPCGGAIVLWLRDLVPGAGWGLLDHRAAPKVAYHHLRRALAPVAVWTTDEGLGGVAVHVANDRPEPLEARLRVALYRDGEQRVDAGVAELTLPPHGSHTTGVEALVGRFVDAAWAYRFGPPAQDLIVAGLERDGPEGPELLSQAVRFPAGRPAVTEPAERVGLEATARPADDGTVVLELSSRRLAYGVRVDAPGYSAADDAFSVEPGTTRRLLLHPREPGIAWPRAALTALNVEGRVRVTVAEGVPA
jgi:beta-mannosidase